MVLQWLNFHMISPESAHNCLLLGYKENVGQISAVIRRHDLRRSIMETVETRSTPTATADATTAPVLPDSLLTEVQRQHKYLCRLSSNFTFPLFNASRALESQRRSGYRNTAAASREIVDNAIEAGASDVHIVFNLSREGTGRGGRRIVTEIAFIDNGSGMAAHPERPDFHMARYALSWGGGTHFDEPGTIGRFGFGLPNASINQGRRVDVFTRTSADEEFINAYLDLREFSGDNLQMIPPPKQAPLPEWVQSYLKRSGFEVEHGTVVVWSLLDRLTYRTPSNLKAHLLDDFGVTYRYLLTNSDHLLKIVVEGTDVEPVDPLFLLPEGRYYLPPEQGGAQPMENVAIPVRYYEEIATGERHFKKVNDEAELNEEGTRLIAAGAINVRVARFPLGFVVGRQSEGGKVQPVDEDSRRRINYRKGRIGMSFVRAGREIETVDAFPKKDDDVSSGLGNWPLLQSYAYHWGVELRFNPAFDDVFGITNDKQSVRPTDDFWRVLHEVGVDDWLQREQAWQREKRDRSVPKQPVSPDPTPAEVAAQEADAAASTRSQVPEHRKQEAADNLEKKAQEQAQITSRSIEEVREALQKEAARRKYRIDFYESEDGPFYKPEWILDQVVVLINRKHPFYDVLYGDLLKLPGGGRAKEAVDLLLLALGKAELTTQDEQITLWYETQRKKRWSPFLDTAMENLRRRLRPSEEAVVEMSDAPASSAHNGRVQDATLTLDGVEIAATAE